MFFGERNRISRIFHYIFIYRSTHTSETCEITALTVPTVLNQQLAVSLYSADDARTQNLAYNRYESVRPLAK